MAIPPADMLQEEHDEDSGAKRILMYGKTTGSTYTPILLNDDGTIKIEEIMALSELSDVTTGTPSHDDVLVYDTASSLWTASAQAAATTFLGLSDTPSSYSGEASKFVRVNTSSDALEFVTSSATLAHVDLTDMPSADVSDHDGRYYTETEVDTLLTDGTIDHVNLSNIGTASHSVLDTHLTTSAIHFTEASIDHDSITNTHNLTTDIDHDQLLNFTASEHFTEASIDHDNITNTHNLTTDIDHDTLTNAHNLTTDIDHDQLTNYTSSEHFLKSDINLDDLGDTTITSPADNEFLAYDTASSSWINQTSTEAGLNISNWDDAYSHISADGTSHTYINQAVLTTSTPTFENVKITSAEEFGLIIEADTIEHGADRTLTLDLSNADRTLKIYGNVELQDWFNQSVKTTSSPTFNVPIISGLTINYATQDYLLTQRSNLYMAWQAQNSGAQSSYEFYNKDGDATDSINSIWWYKGTPTSITQSEYLQIGFIWPLNIVRIMSSSIGGSSTTRPMVIQTAGQSNQIRLLTDGGIIMATLKSGANQGAAGAAANEIWVDTADQTLKLGT